MAQSGSTAEDGKHIQTTPDLSFHCTLHERLSESFSTASLVCASNFEISDVPDSTHRRQGGSIFAGATHPASNEALTFRHFDACFVAARLKLFSLIAWPPTSGLLRLTGPALAFTRREIQSESLRYVARRRVLRLASVGLLIGAAKAHDHECL